MKWVRLACVMMATVLAGAVVVLGQTEPAQSPGGDAKAAEVRLEGVAGRLRQTMTFATLAVLSPTLSDQRLHAQRIVNWLEGTGGRHFAAQVSPEGEIRGLIEEAQALVPWLGGRALDQPTREQALFFAKNIKAFLELALESSLSAVSQRRLDQAVTDMRKTFAYLSAALGWESGPAYLGGVLVLMHLLVPSPAEGGATTGS